MGKRGTDMKKLLVAALLMLSPAHVIAADRGYSVTDFDRIQVEGPFVVTVETGKAPSARVQGSPAALDQLDLRVTNRTLRIRVNRQNWGRRNDETPQAAKIRISVPMLRQAILAGSGTLTISRMRAEVVTLDNVGSGMMSVGVVETDKLDARITGSANMVVAGKAANATLTGAGSGSLDAKGLAVSDLALVWAGAGSVTTNAKRAAKVDATGSGDVTVLGSPACTVKALGAGTVRCGKQTN